MVGTMDDTVAGAAVLTEQLLGGATEVRDIRGGIERTGMVAFVMALLTQEWSPYLEHVILGSAMGIMANRAIFPHR